MTGRMRRLGRWLGTDCSKRGVARHIVSNVVVLKTVRRWTRAASGAFALLFSVTATADDFDYGLKPRQIADGVHVLIGRTEDFSLANGGNIVNTAFIVGSEGVIVIDTGPSRRYGEQLNAAIARVTPLPVVLVINTHQHPDHIFGNQAFPQRELAALPVTRLAMESEGEGFLRNMYRLNGEWMRQTELVLPHRELTQGPLRAGGRELELTAFAGHAQGDLVVLDKASGTLFAADLVFNGRAPTTPHADLGRWQASLEKLERMPFSRLVPGHGEIADNAAPIRETRDYLQWLDRTLRDGAARGLDMTEMLALQVPAKFSHLMLVEHEYRRSVFHLYHETELSALRPAR